MLLALLIHPSPSHEAESAETEELLTEYVSLVCLTDSVILYITDICELQSMALTMAVKYQQADCAVY